MRNNEQHSKKVGFLNVIRPNLSNELESIIEGGNFRLMDHCMVIRKEITGAASQFEVITAETRQTKGISTIKGNSFNKNEAFVFDKISLSKATSTESGKPAKPYYGGATSDDAALLNATFIISQNGRPIVDLPVADLMKRATKNFPIKNDEEYKQLDSLAYLVDDSPIKMEIHFPEGVSMPVVADVFNYLEVRIWGSKTLKSIA